MLQYGIQNFQRFEAAVYVHILKCLHTFTPVSYTHLDVYKRQLYSSVHSGQGTVNIYVLPADNLHIHLCGIIIAVDGIQIDSHFLTDLFQVLIDGVLRFRCAFLCGRCLLYTSRCV